MPLGSKHVFKEIMPIPGLHLPHEIHITARHISSHKTCVHLIGRCGEIAVEIGNRAYRQTQSRYQKNKFYIKPVNLAFQCYMSFEDLQLTTSCFEDRDYLSKPTVRRKPFMMVRI